MLFLCSLTESYLTVKGAALILSTAQYFRRNAEFDSTDGQPVTSKSEFDAIITFSSI
jgi:hypothetical protein